MEEIWHTKNIGHRQIKKIKWDDIPSIYPDRHTKKVAKFVQGKWHTKNTGYRHTYVLCFTNIHSKTGINCWWILWTNRFPQGHYSSHSSRYQCVFGWELKFISLTLENNAILFSSHCFTLCEHRNSAINSEKDHNLKPLKTDIFLDDAFDLPPCLVFELASRPLRLVTYAITWGFWTNRSV